MSTETCKLEITKEGKSNPRKFYELLKHMDHHYPIIFPDTYKGNEIHEGDGYSAGTIRSWKYVLPGSPHVLVCKERIVEINDDTMFLAIDVYEGDIMNQYKYFLCKVQVFPNGEGNKVTWTLEVEKRNQDAPDPHEYMDLFSVENDKIDAYLLAQCPEDI